MEKKLAFGSCIIEIQYGYCDVSAGETADWADKRVNAIKMTIAGKRNKCFFILVRYDGYGYGGTIKK